VKDKFFTSSKRPNNYPSRNYNSENLMMMLKYQYILITNDKL